MPLVLEILGVLRFKQSREVVLCGSPCPRSILCVLFGRLHQTTVEESGWRQGDGEEDKDHMEEEEEEEEEDITELEHEEREQGSDTELEEEEQEEE